MDEFKSNLKERFLNEDYPCKLDNNENMNDRDYQNEENRKKIKFANDDCTNYKNIVKREEQKINKKDKIKVKNHSKLLRVKVVIHFLLAILTIIQALNILNPITTKMRAQERLFYNIFLDYSLKENEDYNRVIYLYDLDRLKIHFKNSMENFYQLGKYMINKVEYLRNYSVVEFFYINANSYNNTLQGEAIIKKNSSNDKSDFQYNNTNFYKYISYKVDNHNLGPMSYQNQALKTFLNDVVYFRVHYQVKIFWYDEITYLLNCNQWSIYQIYSLKFRSYFTSNLEFSTLNCDRSRTFSGLSDGVLDMNYKNQKNTTKYQNFVNELVWIHIIIIILATYSVIKGWKYMKKFSNKYMQQTEQIKKLKKKTSIEVIDKQNESDDSKESEFYNPLFTSSSSEEADQNVNEKRKTPQINKYKKVFNFWNVFNMLANMIQILGSSLALVYIFNPPTILNFLIGLGCMFAIINISRYIQYSSDYAMIYETLAISFPMVIRYIIGVLPIFLGFLLFGYCMFWESERFSSLSSSLRTLFSMINGDSVYPTFEDLKRENFFLSQIYLYIFNISFLIIFLNLFISIIEESYVVAKIKNKTSFIYKYLTIDSKLVNPKIKSKQSLMITHNFFNQKAEETFYESRFENSRNFSKSQTFVNNIIQTESQFDRYYLEDKNPEIKSYSWKKEKLFEEDLIIKESFENKFEKEAPKINEFSKMENDEFYDDNKEGYQDEFYDESYRDKDKNLFLTDETSINKKILSIENSYDKVYLIISDKFSVLNSHEKQNISDFTIDNLKILSDRLKKLKEMWLKNN